MILETQRLYLRELCQADLPALCRILQDEKTMYAYEGAFSDAEAQEWLDRQLARYRQWGFGPWAVILKETQELIGQCGLTMQPWKGREVLEIGYLFRRQYWHQGYATEAARACKRYAFQTLRAGEVCAIIRDTNTASHHVALRLGMTPADSWVKHYRGVDMPHIRYTVSQTGAEEESALANPAVRPFASGELEQLSHFAERLNAHRETGSLFCCANAEAIRQDFAQNMPYSFACWEDGTPRGLIHCFPDFAKKNADCTLLLNVQGTAYQTIASRLTTAARQALGSDMACTFFFPIENTECRRFLLQTGAQQQANEYIMLLNRTDWHAFSGAPPLRPLQDSEHTAFAALHDAVFPGVYACGQDILHDLNQTRFVFVLPDSRGLAAYGVLKFQGGAKATAEMIGVREDVRGQGYGRAVLNHLAAQAFTRFGADTLELIVDADNENALHLYHFAGFCISQENHCFILK